MIGLAWYGEASGPSGQCKIWVWRGLLQELSAKLVPQPRVLFSPQPKVITQNALRRHLRWIVTAYYYYFHRSRCPFSGRLLETLKRRSGLEGHRMEGAIMRERATWGAIIGSPLEGCWMLELDCMIRNLAVYQVLASVACQQLRWAIRGSWSDYSYSPSHSPTQSSKLDHIHG